MNPHNIILSPGPGFYFSPNDNEFVFVYLANKVLHRPMDFDVPELPSCDIDPWNLLEDNKEVYYFVKKEEVERKRRETSSGYWEECEAEKVMESDALQGRRKTFAFYNGKRPQGRRSPHWIMYEFRLLSSTSIRGDLEAWRAVKVVVKEDGDDHESD